MVTVYPAIFYKEENGGYSVVFPDLNHLSTCGDDLNEAMEMAIDCLAGYLFSSKLDGEKVPPATPVSEVDVHCEDDPDDTYVESFVNIVAVDVEAYAKEHFSRCVKKNCTIPQWLDSMARARKINFSRVLQEALQERLGVKAM